MKIDKGTYKPKDFGFNMPEVSTINVGLCTCMYDINKATAWGHMTRVIYPAGKLYGTTEITNTICLRGTDARYVYDQGTTLLPSGVMIHEYAHALTKAVFDKVRLEHDDEWVDIISKRLGRPDLASPSTSNEVLGFSAEEAYKEIYYNGWA